MGKREKEMLKGFDQAKKFLLTEAADIVKKNATAKFDETIELHFHLGVDPKKTDQAVRGSTVLPKGSGRKRTVVVLAKGEKVKEALAAGADFAGDSDLIEKIGAGWFDFDVMVATPDMMKDITKLGKLLGPRGLMPTPKAGTVTFDVSRTVKELKAGRIEFKMDDTGNIHAPIGKASFSVNDLIENAQTVINAITSAKPPTAKGTYVRSVTLTSTMGASVRVNQETNE